LEETVLSILVQVKLKNESRTSRKLCKINCFRSRLKYCLETYIVKERRGYVNNGECKGEASTAEEKASTSRPHTEMADGKRAQGEVPDVELMDADGAGQRRGQCECGETNSTFANS